MFPTIPMDLINSVNKRTDHPTIADVWMNNSLKNQYKSEGYSHNPWDPFEISGRGHRAKNHDFKSGFILGAVEARKRGRPMYEGVMAALMHQMQDAWSNHLVSKFGVPGRNIVESMIAFNMRKKNY